MPDTSTQKAPVIDTTADGASILDQIMAEGAMVRGDGADQKKHARDIIGEFVDQILDKKMKVDQDTVAAIQERIAQIDELIGAQLDAILHAPEFQSLEARWRGLHYLVMNTETSTRLKIRVLNVKKDELRKDFEASPEYDRSALFKKVYEEEYGTFGGAPYGLLIGDYEFDGSNPDVGLLSELSKVAAGAHAPFISAASPYLFDMDSFTQIGVPGDLAKLFESTQLIKWREFRESEDSRYVGLTLPHVLMRLPYGPKGIPVDGFVYEESVGSDDRNFLWGNAAYALGQRITNAFAMYGWCAAIRGVEGGGLVENLPVHVFKTSDGDLAVKTPTEVAITDRRENELAELGFIALCYKKNSGQAAFFGGSTTNKPKTYNLPSANANARLSAQLPYIMATSRFAHYIKVMMRDKIGSFASRDNVSTYLNNWIADYVLLSDDAGQDTKARLPLREARIDVTDVPGKPGAYRAVVFLKPHFQLNELSVSMRLVAELPPPAA
jgi:type VI secretion system protein ImpC